MQQTSMATYELDLAQTLEPRSTSTGNGLGSDLLVNNARWFIRMRWMVSAILALAGGLSLVFRGPLLSISFGIPFPALFVLSGILAAANLLFFLVFMKICSR